jgi:hypothetical protein
MLYRSPSKLIINFTAAKAKQKARQISRDLAGTGETN